MANLLAIVVLALLAFPAAAAADSCAGNTGCPYTAVTTFAAIGSGAGIAADAAGDVYVADLLNNRVVVYSGSGALLRAFGSRGSQTIDVAVAGDGSRVYALNNGDGTVAVFTGTGTFVTSFGGSGDGKLVQPQAIAVDGGGNVYLADVGRVVKFNPAGTYQGQYKRALTFPQELDVSGSRLYLASATPTGPVLDFLDLGLDVVAPTARMPVGGFPQGLAASSVGEIFASDSATYAIEEYESSGQLYTYWGGRGTAATEFAVIDGVAVSGNKLYAMDAGNGRVQVFTLAPAASARPLAVASRVAGRRVAVPVACAARELATCSGSLRLRVAGAHATRSFAIRAGARRRVRLRVPVRAARLLRRRGRLGARLETVTRRPGLRPHVHRGRHVLRARRR